MSEAPKPAALDVLGNRKVTVEIGVGHDPERTVLDRLEDISDIANGEVLHVSIDEHKQNLLHVKHGAVAHMTLHAFAEGDFLDSAAERIYLFNVFGDPTSSAATPEIDEKLFQGLKKKLSDTGRIIIGEHITPKIASQLKDNARLKRLGFDVECYDRSSIAIGAKLKQLGFSDSYIATFVGQSEYNKSTRGPEHAGFLLLLRKSRGEDTDISEKREN